VRGLQVNRRGGSTQEIVANAIRARGFGTEFSATHGIAHHRPQTTRADDPRVEQVCDSLYSKPGSPIVADGVALKESWGLVQAA
jgi:hypothetical protein